MGLEGEEEEEGIRRRGIMLEVERGILGVGVDYLGWEAGWGIICRGCSRLLRCLCEDGLGWGENA